MAAEDAVVLDSDDVIGVLGIVVPQMKQDLELHTSLMFEFLLVPNNLECNNLSGLVIDTF